MKIEIHRDRCICAGNCTQVAPKYFGQDDSGIVIQLEPTVAESDLETVKLAVEACPVLAIELVDGV